MIDTARMALSAAGWDTTPGYLPNVLRVKHGAQWFYVIAEADGYQYGRGEYWTSAATVADLVRGLDGSRSRTVVSRA
jgi:hypothetical protein